MRLLLAVLLFLPTQLLAFEIVFPHFADGVTGETRVVTSLMIVNSDARDTTVSVVFRTGSGTRYTVELFDVETGSFLLRGSELDILVPSRKTVFLKTRGVEPIGSGWAVITVPEGYKVGGTLIFTLSNTRTGEIQTMVGVGSSPGRSTFFMPTFRDSAQRSNTAMALANNSEDSALLNTELYYAFELIDILKRIRERSFVLEAPPILGRASSLTVSLLGEATRCHLFGFNRACVALCRACLEKSLKDRVPPKEQYQEQRVQNARTVEVENAVG